MPIDVVKMEDALMKPATKALATPTGSRFRLLSDGDTIQAGDEILLDDAETWEPVGKDDSIGENWMVGSTYRSEVFMPARRKIHSENV